MAFYDRVQETSTTTGTGALTLQGATTGYQSFASAVPSGIQINYTVADPITGAWEVGLGSISGGTLVRSQVLSSSNSGSLVNFGGNQKYVFVDFPAALANIAIAAAFTTGAYT